MLLSVCVLTYNHEKYIAQALDSVLMQKTDFEFEVLVGEDCSSDGTADIVRGYAAKDSRIKPYFSPVNTGGLPIIEYLRTAAAGDYVAWLDGDDYWTDSHKLQKQMDFLRAHPDYAGCTHEVSYVDENSSPRAATLFKRFCPNREFTLADAAAGYLPGHLGSSFVYRNVFREMDAQTRQLVSECDGVVDLSLSLLLSLFGPIRRLEDNMGVYRHVTSSGDSFSAKTHGKNLSLDFYAWAQSRQSMAQTILKRDIDFYITYRDIVYHAFVAMLMCPNKENMDAFLKTYRQTAHKPRTLLYIAGQVLLFPVRKVQRKLHPSYTSG